MKTQVTPDVLIKLLSKPDVLILQVHVIQDSFILSSPCRPHQITHALHALASAKLDVTSSNKGHASRPSDPIGTHMR